MAARTLTEEQWDELDRLRFSTRDARVFRNATIILMSAAGRSKSSIAETLGCSPATVDNMRAAYRRKGADGLTPISPPGRTSRATAEYRAAMRITIDTPPQDLGYGFSVWSVNRLRQHLKQTTGIEMSDDQLRRIMHQEGYSFQRPKHTMEGKRDEAAHDKAKGELHDLKKNAERRQPR
jgi:putative transposase